MVGSLAPFKGQALSSASATISVTSVTAQGSFDARVLLSAASLVAGWSITDFEIFNGLIWIPAATKVQSGANGILFANPAWPDTDLAGFQYRILTGPPAVIVPNSGVVI